MGHNVDYILSCERMGVFALFCLADGDYEYDILASMVCLFNAKPFNDVMALLLTKGFAKVANEVVSITPEGRIYLLNHERTIMHDDGTMVLLPSWFDHKRANTKFKDFLKDNARLLINFLSTHSDHVESPLLFVGFLTGKNDGSSASINPGRIVEVSYLLNQLRSLGYLQLSTGHDWCNYIEENISPFSISGEKEQIKKYVRMSKGIRWLKTNTVRHIDDFILSLEPRKSK